MPSLIAELRALAPNRPLAPYEARRVAELQAARLLKLQEPSSEVVPMALPRRGLEGSH